MTAVVAISNQKGGVGKSTTTYHLARAAHTQGIPTLVIDMDPQGNITSSLAGESVTEDQAGVADALSTRAPETLQDVLVPTIWSNVTLAPTVSDVLAVVRDEMVIAGAGRESRLKEALASVVANYELVLIDCPPSLDQLALNSMTAASQVLVVTHPGQYSANGLGRLLETIRAVRSFYNPQLRVAGVLINQYDKQTRNDGHWRLEIERALESNEVAMLEPVIPKRAMIKGAAEAGYGLDEWPEATEEAQRLHGLYSSHLATLLS